MKTENATCPAESVLAEFGLGKLDAASADTVSQHLDTCTDCRDRVASLSGDSFVNRLRNMPGHAADPGQAPIDRTFMGNSAGGADSPRDERMAKTAKHNPSTIDSAPPELANHPDYELLKELGRGGMGVVYLARNRMMDRLEVLKVVNKSLLDRPEALERFQQEIRSAARLAHANIVAAYSVLRPGDLLVFAMEYVRGQDLSQVVKQRGTLPVANAAFYIHQVALGLQHAFEKGMVHRDIKPNNLMLAIEGKKHTVKILDFGLSKATSEKGAEAGLTKSGQMLGTPDYVAPEQTLNAQRADIRADIYSLGCTLYYLLSGGPPFQEASLYGILEAHQKRDARPLNLLRPEVPVELAAVVGKMMAKDPAKRYQTPAEVARALVPFFKPGQAAATADVAPPERSHAEAERSHSAANPSRAIGGLAADSAAVPPSPAVPSSPQYRPIPVATPLPAPLSAAVARPDGDIGISIHTRSRPKARCGWWSTLPPWRQRVAVAGASAFLLLGISFFVRTPHGTIEITLSDPMAKVTVAVDGDKVDIEGLDDPLSLQVGEHDLKVKGKDYETITEKFSVTKGKNAPLTVTLRKKKPPKTETSDTPLPAIAPFNAKQAQAHQAAWAKHLGTKVEIENSLGMKLRLVPPGEFMTGSPQEEIDALVLSTPSNPVWQGWFQSEGPQHCVQLTKAFYLGSCEVTQRQYQEVMGANPSHFSRTGAGKDEVQGLDTGEFPVEMVSWFDAVDFCNKLSEREQRSPYYVRDGEAVTVLGGTGYRLPTEAEWEHACRAGSTTRWSFGDNETKLRQHAVFNLNADHRTHRVGELATSPFGLYDLYGNVWEWCWDWHGEYTAATISDPTPPTAGTLRVLRGGAFNQDAVVCRSAARTWTFRWAAPPLIGFRVARTIDTKSEALPAAGTDGSAAPANDTDPGKANLNPPKSAIAPFDAKQAMDHQEAWAKHLGTKVEIENSLGMKLRLIPPGEFMMGSTQAEIDALVQSTTVPYWHGWFRSEGPQYRVKLTQGFYLASCEVTQQQYQELMGVNPSHFSLTGPGKGAVKDLDTGQHPVEMVSWFDAVDFCNKLSEKEQRPPYYVRDGDTVKVRGGAGYRLPTEAEWEYACRAGTATRWSFGDNETNLSQHAWFGSTAGGTTHRVAALSANPFGLYDLYGNVWEWCWDWHGEYTAGAASDPPGSAVGSERVRRGGAFFHDWPISRSALHFLGDPLGRNLDTGFRVARTIDAKGEVIPPDATSGSTTQASDTAPVAVSVNPPQSAIAPFDAQQAKAHQEAWAKHLGTKVEIENSLGMKLRLIPPGEFMMGSPQEEIDALVATTTEPQWWQDLFRSEGPRHRVKLTQAFYLGSCEVTQRQYQDLIGVNPSGFSPSGPNKDAVKDLDTGHHPVDSVSWFDAVDFCNKLSEKERRPSYYVRDGDAVKVLGGTGYRLPTEAEWEYACRAGTTTRWSFGDTERDLAQHAWFPANSNGRTQRVGELPANPFGLHDLYGNVWEWCWDWHGKYAAGAVSDPMGSAAGSARVVRGGAYNGGLASYCRSAIRGVDAPVSLSRYGFRVCCGR